MTERERLTEALLLAGAKLSNAAFNLSQRQHITKQDAESLTSCYREWDVASRTYHAAKMRRFRREAIAKEGKS